MVTSAAPAGAPSTCQEASAPVRGQPGDESGRAEVVQVVVGDRRPAAQAWPRPAWQAWPKVHSQPQVGVTLADAPGGSAPSSCILVLTAVNGPEPTW